MPELYKYNSVVPSSRSSRVCVLVSGGLDSCALLAELAKRRVVYPVYVRQGLAWESIELYWLERFLGALKAKSIRRRILLDLPMRDLYGRHWSTGGAVPDHRSKDEAVYLPGRNLTLTVKAAVFCAMNGISEIALGSLSANPFPDASKRFFGVWAKGLSLGLNHRLRITAPYRRLIKSQVIRRVADAPLHLSFSCLSPKGREHCGRCNKCAERQKAFTGAGVKDQTRYAR